MEFAEAIQTLLNGCMLDGRNIMHISHDEKSRSPPEPPQNKPLALPAANKNNDAVYAYLQGRGIDKGIIKRCIANGSLYEAAKTHHCVFIGFDGDKPKYACMRGITGNLKQDARNSDKRYGFLLPPKNPDSRNLAVLESPVDVLSHATVYEIGSYDWDGYRLSLGGVSPLALRAFLERHGDIEHIYLSLDSDNAGKEATSRIIKELLTDKRFSHIKITIAPPPLGKDFNDTLQAIRETRLNQALPLNRSPER